MRYRPIDSYIYVYVCVCVCVYEIYLYILHGTCVADGTHQTAIHSPWHTHPVYIAAISVFNVSLEIALQHATQGQKPHANC